MRIGSRDMLGSHDPLVRSLVGEHRLTGHVSDGVHPLGAGAAVLVDLHEPVRELDAGCLQAETLGHRLSADGHQNQVGLDLLLALRRFHRQSHRTGVAVQRLHHGPRANAHPPLLERALQRLADLRILDRHQVRQRLHDRYFDAEGAEHVRKLHSDKPRAHDHHSFRQLAERQGFTAADHPLAIELEAGKRLHDRPRGDDHALGVQGARFTACLGGLDGHLTGRREAATSGYGLHSVLLEQVCDTLAQLLADLPAAVDRGSHVVVHVDRSNAELGPLDLQRLGKRRALE